MDSLTAERMMPWASRSVGAVALSRATVSLAAAAFASYWIAVGLMRWQQLEVGAFDFAFFDQIIWNTSQGRPFDTTFSPYNFVGQHFEPVLLLFAVAYRAGMPPLGLLVVQALVVGGSALALFEAGRALRLPLAVSTASALGYLASPLVQRALVFDFHPETMVSLPAFAAVWAFATSRARLGAACALAVLLFKEDTVFVVLALALCAWTLGARRTSFTLAATAVAWAVIIVLAVMPLVRGSEPSDLVERYEAVFGGHAGADAVGWVVTHPLALLGVLAQPARLATVSTFIAASGPWLLLAPLHALALTPGLLLAILSSHGPQQALALHYGVELVPVAAIAGLFGARRLARLAPSGAVAALMVISATAGLLALGPPLALEPPSGPTPAHREAVARAVALVPTEAAVSAQSNLAARLARRRQIWEFPGQWWRAEWVVVDRYGFRSQQSLDAGFERELSIVRASHTLVFDEDGVTVYRVDQR